MVALFRAGSLRGRTIPGAGLPALLCAAFLVLSGCNADVLGIFGATDFNERLRDRNTFQYLRDSERGPGFTAPYTFIVLSDTHIEGGNTRGLEGITEVVQAEGAAFVVITGDITQDGRRGDLERFVELGESLRSLSPPVPLYPVIGNHDIYFGNWSVWRDLIGSTIYRIDSPDTTLLILDSANANFGSEQLDWLEDQLQSVKKHSFVFTHANLFTESITDFEMLTDTRERARMLSMLRGRCDVVFAGHVHRRIVRNAGGVWYITQEDFRDHAAYCLVRVDAAGTISWEFKKL
jgi:3',5'-cyclic AMP phosphodiesterase CpdA